MSSDKSKKYFISKRIDHFFLIFSDVASFIGRFFKETFRRPFEWNELIKQSYEVGYKSLALITLTGFITGVVFTKQSRPSLAEFGAQSWLPSLVAIAVIKSLAPLVTAIICAGKVGSGIGAELGSMRVTEQIDAMEVSAVKPFKYLVNTRIGATTAMIPMLMLYTAFVSMMGSYLDIYLHEQTSFTFFVQSAFSKITFLDITSSIIRSIVFGFTIGAVGCYKGYHTTGGTQGVGKAANAAVVTSMFLIFIEEVIILQIINYFR
ncbi:MAG TPA: ABC transporter permease [Flavisolibacter sp.]|jgi:phospholipid/cholesterol/gamma-HCH transport system permease protein|nr:ABC transporter permease [Flavisolibacter sp.]